MVCSYITEQASIVGSAKGPIGWMAVDRATVYYDHPYHAPLDHSLNIDFVNASDGAGTRVAVELSAESARELVRAILAALEQGGAAHLGGREAVLSSLALCCLEPGTPHPR